MLIQFQPTGPLPARIMLVGEAPGENEVRDGAPFVGFSGQELNRMLQEAGISRAQCFLTNVCRERPAGNDIGQFIAMRKADITGSHIMLRDRFVLPPIRDGLAMLKREIEMCKPHVIIAFGNVAMWALTGKWGITSWRGSVLQCDLQLALDYQPKVVPTYHPAAILRQWTWRPIGVHDLKRAVKESQSVEINRPDYEFIIRPNYTQAVGILAMLYDAAERGELELSVDLETRAGHIACIGIAWSNTQAICIPLMCVERVEGYWQLEEEVNIVHALYCLLTHPAVKIDGQNFLYDAQYIFRHWHFIVPRVFDTMIGQHSLFGTMPKGLDFLSSMYCEFHEYWKDEGKEWNQKIPEEQYWEYNCKDAVKTFEIKQVLQVTTGKMRLDGPSAFQQSLFHPVLRTMNRGVRVDTKLKAQFGAELEAEMQQRLDYLKDMLGFDINLRSPKQMQALFYDLLKQKPVINRKTGTVSCDVEALRKIMAREPLLKPIVHAILEYRSLGVFHSTFVEARLDIDSRLRCSYNIAGTETYRFSSTQNAFGSGLNLQNVPSGGEFGDDSDLQLPNVRRLFIPDEGMTFFDIDLDSADLRVVVAEADIPEMLAMLNEGKKIYVEVMKEYYRDPTLTKASPKYTIFKSLCHGTHYLGTADGLAQRLGLGVHEVSVVQKWYYGKFPQLKRWQDDIKDQVSKRRMVENVFGYRCYFFDRIEGTVYNQAVAWIPQSTVGCLINRAYVEIDRSLPWAEVLLQVHDSLAGQFPTSMGDDAMRQIVAAATIPLPYSKPLTIPVGVKTSDKSWGDCA